MNLYSINAETLLVLQREFVGETGASPAECDRALLEEALSFPLGVAMAGEADVAAIAAAHVAGILKFRPFAAGNVQAAFLAMGLFLYSNDWRLTAGQDVTAEVIRKFANGDVDEKAFADWIRRNL